MKHQRALCNAAVTKHSNYTIIKKKKKPTTFFSLFHLSNLHLTATSEPTTNMSLLPPLPRSQSDWAQHCSLTHLIPVLRLLWLTPKPKNRDTTGSQASETPEVFFLFCLVGFFQNGKILWNPGITGARERNRSKIQTMAGRRGLQSKVLAFSFYRCYTGKLLKAWEPTFISLLSLLLQLPVACPALALQLQCIYYAL